MITLAVNAHSFTYTVEDINNSVRKTNTLLRAANALRLTVRDFKDLLDKPTAARFFWTLIQLGRTYNALRRLQKNVIASMNKGLMPGMMRIPEPGFPPSVPGTPPSFNLNDFVVRVDAFRENIPIGLPQIDISEFPEDSKIMLQALMEEEAQITVDNAKALLHGRILHPEESTGFLESSIRWQQQLDGVRILADAPYAWWVERGHRTPGGYFPGHWYMTDAVNLARERLPERIRNELNGLIFQES